MFGGRPYLGWTVRGRTFSEVASAGAAVVVLVAAVTVAVVVLLSSSGGRQHRSSSAPGRTALAYSVCPAHTVVTMAHRSAAGLHYWPDGTFGVLRLGGHVRFIAANGGGAAAETGGTSGDPLTSGVLAAPRLQTRLATNYASGGPVYRDASNGRWLLFYHAERWPGGNPAHFYSWIGMAVSTNQGRSWVDLGPIIRPERPYRPTETQIVEVAGGPFVVAGGYFYVYFRDVLSGGSNSAGVSPPTAQLAVARARVSSVLAAAAHGRVTAWHDFYAGRWGQPALGGRADPLEPGNPPTRWFDVGYDAALHRYILVVAADALPAVNLDIAFSRDGLRWTPRQPLERGVAESFYPTLVGTGPDPTVLGRAFYVYYTSSLAGGFARWSDAVLDRLMVRVGTTSLRCPSGGP